MIDLTLICAHHVGRQDVWQNPGGAPAGVGTTSGGWVVSILVEVPKISPLFTLPGGKGPNRQQNSSRTMETSDQALRYSHLTVLDESNGTVERYFAFRNLSRASTYT